MLAQTAVMLRKSGMSCGQIADQLGVTAAQVSNFLRVMDFDPVEYHLDQIADLVTSGVGLYAALEQCGFSVGGPACHRIHGRLLDRGVSTHGSKKYEYTPKRKKDTRPRCLSCTILLEPDEHEYCSVCSNVRAGGSWLGHMPLAGPEVPEPVSLREVFAWR